MQLHRRIQTSDGIIDILFNQGTPSGNHRMDRALTALESLIKAPTRYSVRVLSGSIRGDWFAVRHLVQAILGDGPHSLKKP